MKYTLFWEGRPYAIIIMAMVSESVTSEFVKKTGCKVSEAINIYENEKDSWLYKTDEILEGGKKLLVRIKKGEFIDENIRDIYEVTDELGKASQVLEEDLSKYSNKELIDIFKKTTSIFKKFYGPAFVPIFLECGENLLSEASEEVIRRKLRQLGKEDKFAEYYVPLLTPPNPTIPIQEELDLLKMLDEIGSRDISVIRKHVLLKEHIAKNAWIYFNIYDKFAMNEKEYIARIKEILESDGIKKRISEIENYDVNVLNTQNKLTAELKFNKEDARIIDATRQYGLVKEYRKNMIVLVAYRLYLFVKEVGKRIDVDFRKLWFLLPEEIEKVFEDFDERIPETRMRKCVVVSKNGKSEILLGEKADKKISEMDYHVEIVDTSELKGTPACLGRVRGKVKIVNRLDEADKMEKGDILVSVATFPELVPAMKKAAAIVTDEGGVTCHAAIVSRELKTPCVIGTKIATKVLKDGDLVEVDAGKGIVRRL